MLPLRPPFSKLRRDHARGGSPSSLKRRTRGSSRQPHRVRMLGDADRLSIWQSRLVGSDVSVLRQGRGWHSERHLERSRRIRHRAREAMTDSTWIGVSRSRRQPSARAGGRVRGLEDGASDGWSSWCVTAARQLPQDPRVARESFGGVLGSPTPGGDTCDARSKRSPRRLLRNVGPVIGLVV